MLRRVLFLVALLLLPLPAQAEDYLVRTGDTLSSIATRYHVSLSALARANGIRNINFIPAGRVLTIPADIQTYFVQAHTFYYRVRWGDTLLGITARYHLDLATIRSLNPQLGSYPLAGQLLKLCGPCSSGSSMSYRSSGSAGSTPSASSGVTYIVQPGDTISSIARNYGIAPSALVTANHIWNPNHIVVGTRLSIPRSWMSAYDPWSARSLIVSYARQYGLSPSLPLAIAWQESGFNQNMISRTGAVGVMQVEPYTAQHISTLTGRSYNLYNVDDNVHAGVYWLGNLLSYYGGNERLAVAAYYQGTRSLDSQGFFNDTVQYVNNVEALKSNFGG